MNSWPVEGMREIGEGEPGEEEGFVGSGGERKIRGSSRGDQRWREKFSIGGMVVRQNQELRR